MARQRIIELKKLYNVAEQHAKEVENLRSEVQIPAVNELRYAGYHVLKAIDEDGNVTDDHLSKAQGHCERAMYEAAEAGIMFCLEMVKRFQYDYQDVVVSEVISDYPDRLARAQQAVNKIIAGRADRESVESQVAEYMDEFRTVRDIMEVLEASRDDLNVKRAQADGVRRRDYIRIAVMILAAVLALLATILVS